MMKIILIDDQQLFRDGFRELLSHEADLSIVSEGNDAADGVAAARSKDPDLVVYDLTVKGVVTAELGRVLCISPRTVETHRARILQKLGAHSIVDLVRVAARLRLLAD